MIGIALSLCDLSRKLAARAPQRRAAGANGRAPFSSPIFRGPLVALQSTMESTSGNTKVRRAGIVSFGVLNTRNPLVGYMKHAPPTHGNHATRVVSAASICGLATL